MSRKSGGKNRHRDKFITSPAEGLSLTSKLQLNNEDLILSIDGKDVDSMTIPEVQQMLINVDEVS